MCCRRPVYTISDLYSTILDVGVVELSWGGTKGRTMMNSGVGSYVL